MYEERALLRKCGWSTEAGWLTWMVRCILPSHSVFTNSISLASVHGDGWDCHDMYFDETMIDVYDTSVN